MLISVLKRTLLLVLINTLLPGCVFAKPLVYVAKSVSGQVVDADSGQPLEGVIVTINWELRGGMHEYPQGQAHVDEAVTDAQGKFTFPGWGPKPAPVTAHLYSSAPQLLFFKSGYDFDRCDSDLDTDVNTRFPLSSDCDGKTIKLKRFEGSLKEYAERLGALDINLSFATGGGNKDCAWKQIPRMLVTLHQEKKRFREKRIYNSISPLTTMPNQKNCGSAEEFFRSYLP